MKKGWEKKRLGDVSTINYGYTESASSDPIGPRYLRITDIQNDSVDWNMVPFCRVEADELPKYQLKTGDIVFARTGATTGKSYLVVDPPDSVFASYLIRLRLTHALILPEFVALYFQTGEYWKSIKEGSTGSAQGGFNATKLSQLSIPVPTLNEQRRIVGVLDEAFAGIATAWASAEKNLRKARELFESHLNAIFTQRGEGWVEKTLGDIADFKNGLNYRKDSKGQTLRVVGVGDFQKHSVVPLDQLQYATIDGEVSRDCVLREGDILTVRSNGSADLVGRCMLVPPLAETTSFSSFIIRIRVEKKFVFPEFLLHFMKSSETRMRLTSDGGGANISNINQTKLSALPVTLPPVDHQMDIVSQIDALSAETQNLARIYERKLAALDELKKSLLHQAFSGQL